LDKKEMELIIEAIYDLMDEDNRKGENAPKERVKQIMKQLDKDQNGVLSQEEFVQGIFFLIIIYFLFI
jgi:Ca2+-binding EF-hand superfamily protein